MPLLGAADLVDLGTEPAAYPGRPIRDDSLLAGGWIYPMASTVGAPVGDYRVTLDGGPLPGEGSATLDEALSALGAAPIGERYPVLAVGSNAASGQLARKFGDAWPGTVVPVTATYVAHLGVAHSAHINRAGYMPYAPCHEVATGRQLVALWLDATQLQRVNETEPNYHACTLERDVAPADLSSREPLHGFIVYRSRWGVYRPQHFAPPLPATTQPDVYSQLGSLPWFLALVPEAASGPLAAMAALAGDPERRAAVGEHLAQAGRSADDGLGPVTYEPHPYSGGGGTPSWDDARTSG